MTNLPPPRFDLTSCFTSCLAHVLRRRAAPESNGDLHAASTPASTPSPLAAAQPPTSQAPPFPAGSSVTLPEQQSPFRSSTPSNLPDLQGSLSPSLGDETLSSLAGRSGPSPGLGSGFGGAGEQLLTRLRSEAEGRLQLQQQVLQLERQNVENAIRADGLALELEAMRRER